MFRFVGRNCEEFGEDILKIYINNNMIILINGTLVK